MGNIVPVGASSHNGNPGLAHKLMPRETHHAFMVGAFPPMFRFFCSAALVLLFFCEENMIVYDLVKIPAPRNSPNIITYYLSLLSLGPPSVFDGWWLEQSLKKLVQHAPIACLTNSIHRWRGTNRILLPAEIQQHAHEYLVPLGVRR